MTTQTDPYPARLEVDYQGEHDRLSTFFRPIWALPIAVVVVFVSATGEGLGAALMLMILFRRKYPRWWFDFSRELTGLGARFAAYLALLTDRYPSIDEEQSVRIEVDYPEAERDLNRWLPLVKWFLAIPHYVVLAFLVTGAAVAVLIAWFAVLFTGRFPRELFDYVVGVGRWCLRVHAYTVLLTTDRYPPFSLS